jgi:hypothetical protein
MIVTLFSYRRLDIASSFLEELLPTYFLRHSLSRLFEFPKFNNDVIFHFDRLNNWFGQATPFQLHIFLNLDSGMICFYKSANSEEFHLFFNIRS